MIQIDMPMPNSCRMCPACSEYYTCLIPIDGKGFGEQNVSEYAYSRPEWCPMKEQEAKTGCWVHGHCSYCGEDIGSKLDSWSNIQQFLFCPKCGAKILEDE